MSNFTNNFAPYILIAYIVMQGLQASAQYAGEDQTVCASEITLSAAQPSGTSTGFWKIISGSAEIVAPTSAVTLVKNLAPGTTIFRYTYQNKKGSLYDDVRITNYQIAADAGASQVVCSNQTVLTAKLPSGSTGSWSVLSGNASFNDIHNPNTHVSNIGLGENHLSWAVANEYCSTRYIVTIYNNSIDATEEQTYIETCTNSIRLTAVLPPHTSGYWQVISGKGNIMQVKTPATVITNMNEGINSFRWTTESDFCTQHIDYTINNQAVKAIAPSVVSICDNSALLIGNAPKSNATGYWTSNSGAEILNANDFQAFAMEIPRGKSEFWWTIENQICKDSTKVIVNNRSFDIVDTQIKAVSCNGASDGQIVLKTNSSSESDYIWNNGRVGNQVNNLTAGTYKVEAISGGCNVEKTIIVPEPEEIEVLINQTMPDCQGKKGALKANVSGGTAPYNLKWSTGDNSELIQDLAVGIYEVYVTDAQGCKAEKSIELSMQQVPAQILGDKTVGELATTVFYSDTKADKYLWDVIGGEIIEFNDGQSVTIAWGQAGVGALKLTIENNCGSQIADIFSVNITSTTTLAYTPIQVTPDGDGVNDYLLIPELLLFPNQYPNNELLIFDVSGIKVYKASSYRNNWFGEGNIETSIGKATPDGLYRFVFKRSKYDPAPREGYFMLEK